MRPKNLALSDEQVHHLEILASRPKTAQRSVYRAKIILSRLAGVGVRATAYGREPEAFSPCRERSMGR